MNRVIDKFKYDVAIVATMCASVCSVSAQLDAEIIKSPRNVRVQAIANECLNEQIYKCSANYAFYRTNATKPFQVISINTTFATGDTIRDVEFGDFNFDGLEDVAISDGMEGGYITPSYQIFTLSSKTNRYVHRPEFTKLSQGPSMGLFTVDKKKRMLFTQWREGCCYFIKEGYAIVRGRPMKISKLIVDESSADRKWDVITTSRLVKGRWKTWIKRKKPQS